MFSTDLLSQKLVDVEMLRGSLSAISLCNSCCERNLPFVDADEDWRSTTGFSSDFLSSLILPDVESLSASGKCFGCRFFI
jgi:hypothetical protein